MRPWVHRHVVVALAAGLWLLLQSVGGLAELAPEQSSTRTLGPWEPHWVLALDANFPYLTANKAMLVDGDGLDMLGMLSTGYQANVEVSPDRREIYAIETYHSRLTRGERTDVVTVYDARTLFPVAEIEIPPKRFLVVIKRHVTGLTPDGRFLLVFNMTPATSVSVVDVAQRRFVGEIETPGCSLVYPGAPRRFSMICADGSLLTVTLDESGHEVEKRRSPRLFDPDDDPVFEHTALVGSRMFMVSYEGKVYEVDLSGSAARLVASWSLLNDEDKAQSWRPGGWQLVSVHRDGTLYVLMHQGGRWTHKHPGSEVWAYDTATRRRIARTTLEHPANSILVTHDDDPLLFALSEHGTLQAYRVNAGQYLGIMESVGISPFLLIGG